MCGVYFMVYLGRKVCPAISALPDHNARESGDACTTERKMKEHAEKKCH